ncbi:MAG: 5-oxoprolinase subunit PxpB [Acidobacteriota bacterium]
MTAVTVAPAGDRAFLLRVGSALSPELAARVLGCLDALDAARRAWVVDLVPAYGSILVEYDPLRASSEEVRAWVSATVESAAVREESGRCLVVPVWYGPESGSDLLEVADLHGLSVDDVVGCHTGREYLVYMLGFKPGFPYMGEVDGRIATERLATPRAKVPAGSVAIAGRQTGIYPVDSPGGWRILGRTPLRIFDPERTEPFLVQAGDRVRFEAIDRERFVELANREGGAAS